MTEEKGEGLRRVTKWNEPLEKETSKAFAAFCVYRNLGVTRSVDKVAEQARQNPVKTSSCTRCLDDWSSRFKWVERAKAYDVYQLEQQRMKNEAAFAKRRLEVKAEDLSYLEHIKKVFVELLDGLRECSNPDKKLDRLSNIMDAFRWTLERERLELGMAGGDENEGASASIRTDGETVSIEAKLDRIAQRNRRRSDRERVPPNLAQKSAFGDD